jgi:hypothetical protein
VPRSTRLSVIRSRKGIRAWLANASTTCGIIDSNVFAWHAICGDGARIAVGEGLVLSIRAGGTLTIARFSEVGCYISASSTSLLSLTRILVGEILEKPVRWLAWEANSVRCSSRCNVNV